MVGVTTVQKSLLAAVSRKPKQELRGRSSLLRLSIFGLGYVGTVCAGCFAQEGYKIIGVDPVPTKVDLINAGKSTIVEAEIGRIHS